MEVFVPLFRQMLVVLVLFSERIDCTRATGTEVWGTDIRHSGDSGYFFYQQSEYPSDCQEALRECTSQKSSGVYVIKPDGYSEPFDVYCEYAGSSGWTVIQRRVNGLVNFARTWEDYKDGFGFLSNNYWLGNDRLSYLTNQAVYELRVDVQLSNGSSLYVTYSGFRISDGWDNYTILSIGDFNSGEDGLVTFCPHNMIYGNCTCGGTCAEPTGSSVCHCELGREGCFCPAGFLMNGEECVPPSECPCFWPELNVVFANDSSSVSDNCTERRNCTNNQLVSEDGYLCGTNAECAIRNGTRQCYCNEGYAGNGLSCIASYYDDCYDAYTVGRTHDGIHTLLPTGWTGPAFDVSCAMDNGGGWTVFQKRKDGTIDFYLDWDDYKRGFGDVNTSYWLGNDRIASLTTQGNCQLRIDMTDFDGESRYAIYDDLRIGDESEHYKLYIGNYSGSAGDSLSYHRNMYFSTKDRDNDADSRNCATTFTGAWWYNNCHNSNLNGLYRSRAHGKGVNWSHWHGYYYSLKTTEMSALKQEMITSIRM